MTANSARNGRDATLILAGDVGGTKVAFGLFEEAGSGLRPVREARFVSREFASFEDVLARFLADQGEPLLRAACCAVAGPVIGGRCATTNLPWVLDEAALARAAGVPRARLVNDGEAAAYGMLWLGDDEVHVLQRGQLPVGRGNVALIAAGTGLAEAVLSWDGSAHHAVASEGGHADFAPRTEVEIELLRYLRAAVGGRVSYERVLSGPGIVNVYSFLRDTGYAPEPAWLAEKLRGGDRAAAIAEVGLAGTEPLCARALELFVSLYGAEAGNLALKCVAVGGVFVGGGIAPKILPALQRGDFMRSFTDKGRFSGLLERIEVRVALNPRAPLLGAAHCARR